MTNTLTLRRGAERGRTRISWLDSWHSFSFGRYYDPDNMGYRALRVINDDVISSGGGFGEHGHDNMEIITWMLDGELKHGDSLGHLQPLRRGEVQVMSAGRGIRHSEFNGSSTRPARLLQIWIEPSERNVEPRYQQKAFDAELRHNRWLTLATGRWTSGATRAAEAAPIAIQQDAAIQVATLDAGAAVEAKIEADRHGYLHVALGKIEVDGQTLGDGDAVTFEGPATLRVRAVDKAEVLLFDLA